MGVAINETRRATRRPGVSVRACVVCTHMHKRLIYMDLMLSLSCVFDLQVETLISELNTLEGVLI